MHSAEQCDECRAAGPVEFAQFSRVIGLLIAVKYKMQSGHYCPSCARKLIRRHNITNLTLGLVGPISAAIAMFLLARNFKNYRQYKSRLQLGPRGGWVGRLPWAKMIGFGTSVGGGRGTLAGGMVLLFGALAGLSAFFAITFFLLRFDSAAKDTPAKILEHRKGNDQVTRFFLMVFGPSLLLYGCAYAWWVRSEQQEYELTDILGQLYPDGVILESGRVHIVGMGLQIQQGLRFILAVQNLHQSPTQTSITFDGMDGLQELNAQMPGQSVMLYHAEIPIQPPGRPSILGTVMRVRTAGNKSARVHSGGRTFLSNPGRDAIFSGLAALGGSHALGPSRPVARPGPAFVQSDGRLEIVLESRSEPAKPSATSGRWSANKLGLAGEIDSLDTMAKMILIAMSRPSRD